MGVGTAKVAGDAEDEEVVESLDEDVCDDEGERERKKKVPYSLFPISLYCTVR